MMTIIKTRIFNVKNILHTVILLLAFILGIFTHKYLLNENKATRLDSSSHNQHSLSFSNSQQQTNTNLESIEQTNTIQDQQSSEKFNNKARELAEKKPNILNNSMLNITIASWAIEDPIAALEFALSHQNHFILADLVMSISGKNQEPIILEWLLANKNHPQYTYLEQSYFTAFATEDPLLALDKMQNAYPEKAQGNILMAIIDSWATQNAEAVLTWLDSREKNALTVDLQNIAMNHYIKQNPQDAAIDITHMRTGDNKRQLISAVADTLAKQNIDEAIKWAETLPIEEQKNAISTVMNQWVTNGYSETALNYLLARDDLQADATLLSSTIINIAQNDTDLLINRLEEFSDNNKNMVIQEIASALIYQGNNSDYENWYQSLPMGAEREAASIPVIEANIRTDPELAFRYAENIISINTRKLYLIEAAKSWANYDPNQARSAIESSDVLTVAQKNEILAEFQY
ncbi:hypothetical protein ACM9HF_06850 [Colwellia sp. RE-S-Sl-9]